MSLAVALNTNEESADIGGGAVPKLQAWMSELALVECGGGGAEKLGLSATQRNVSFVRVRFFVNTVSRD